MTEPNQPQQPQKLPEYLDIRIHLKRDRSQQFLLDMVKRAGKEIRNIGVELDCGWDETNDYRIELDAPICRDLVEGLESRIQRLKVIMEELEHLPTILRGIEVMELTPVVPEQPKQPALPPMPAPASDD